VRFGRSRSSKVIDFGTNRKRVVRLSNLGPILHCFRDIAGFCAQDPTLFHPNFGVFPLDEIAHVGVSPDINLKLKSAVKYFQSISTYVITIPERLRLTERRTDRQTTYCGIAALCVASRSKQYSIGVMSVGATTLLQQRRYLNNNKINLDRLFRFLCRC